MERKLIKQGGGGFTIYLPKKWIDKKGLKEGQNITILERDTNLIIGSSVKEKKTIHIDMNKQNRDNIRTMLTHIYRKGFDTITIRNIDDELVQKIQLIARERLLGFELIERDEKNCILENISEPTEEKYGALLRRCFLIIKETFNLIEKDLETNEFKRLKEIEDFMKQQEKYILFCRRITMKEKYEQDPIINWELLTFIMHIEHTLYYLYKYASTAKIVKEKDTIEIFKSLKQYFELYYEAFFKKDINYVHQIHALKDEYQFGKCFELIKNSKNPVINSFIREIFRLIQIGTSPILSGLFEETEY
jgi:phosphate uptake regulator